MKPELVKIALRCLGLDYLGENCKGSDRLRHDDVRIALEAAYEAGRRNPLPTYPESFGEARGNDW